MTLLAYFVEARDDSGERRLGLTPSFVFFKKSSDLVDIGSAPLITEVGNGVYRIMYDAALTGEAIAQVDFGAGSEQIAISSTNRYSTIQLNDTANNVVLQNVETGETLIQALRLIRAVLLGRATVSGTSNKTVVFTRSDGTTSALTVSGIDGTGNRTTITKGTV